jgi:hypothetical protein
MYKETKRMDSNNLNTFCTLTGTCYDLARQFMMTVPWSEVLKNAAVSSGKKVWESRNAYKLVLKEAQIAQQIYYHFKTTVVKIEKWQHIMGLSICSLDQAKTFIKDFGKVLSMYTPENVSVWQANIAGESLREELQHYITFIHSIMNNVLLELQSTNLMLQSAEREQNPLKRKVLLSILRDSCSVNYGMPTDYDNDADSGVDVDSILDSDSDDDDVYYQAAD